MRGWDSLPTLAVLASLTACSSDPVLAATDAGVDAAADADTEGGPPPPCGMSQTRCSGTCVFTASDPINCGSCGHVCPPFPSGSAACTNGACSDPGCGMGWSDCNGNAADGCETQTGGTDAKNCGACGHTCDSGAACAAGVCAPDVLAQAGLISPFAVALSAPDLFVVDLGTQNAAAPDGKVVRIPSTGGTPVTLAGTLASPRDVGVDAQYVYYTVAGTKSGSDGLVMKIGRDGMCGAAPTCPITLASARKTPRALVLDTDYVYWGEGGLAANQNMDGGVYRVKKDGTLPVETVVTPSTDVRALALSDTVIYFMAGGQLNQATKSGSLGTALTAANGGVAFSNGQLFIGDSSRVSVSAADGTSQKVLFSTFGGLALLVDGGDLFMYGNGEAAKSRLDGTCPGGGTCPVNMIMIGSFLDVSTQPMAVDATYLYAVSPAGSVLRVLR